VNLLKIKQSLLAVALLLTAISASSQQTQRVPGTSEYYLDMRVDYNSGKIYAKGLITVFNNTPSPLNRIPVLLYRLLSVRSVKSGDTTLTFDQRIVSIEGWEKLQVNFIEISLNKELLPGEHRKLEIEYDGYLCGYSEAGWRYVKDHVDREFTIIRTDGFGYPVLGLPTESEMMMISKEYYNYHLKITVPEEMVVATGGELINKTVIAGQTTYEFRNKKPSWRIDIAIAKFQVSGKDKNNIYHFEKDSSGVPGLIKAMENAMTLYSEWFGEIPEYKGYTIIEVPEGYGSQSDVTATLITADNFRKTGEYLTIYHELAHLWNVRNLETQPCRIENEGLAQFLQFLLAEKLDHKEKAVSDAANQYLKQICSNFKSDKELQNIRPDQYGTHNLTFYSYTMGMIFFAVYYNLIGHEEFTKIIASYYNKFYNSGATFSSFTDHCLHHSPSYINSFFNDWIYTTKAIGMIIGGKTFEELLQYYRSNPD
jgi:hypothetical protein